MISKHALFLNLMVPIYSAFCLDLTIILCCHPMVGLRFSGVSRERPVSVGAGISVAVHLDQHPQAAGRPAVPFQRQGLRRATVTATGDGRCKI